MKKLLAIGLGIGISVFAQDQSSGLSARQLFFTTRPVAVPAPAATPDPPPKPVSTPATPVVKKKVVKKAPAPVVEKAPEVTTAAVAAVEQQPQAKSQVVDKPYLGLRYSLMQDRSNGAREEVDPEKVFRSGEKFYLSLQSNNAAYLYVVLEASQGNWEVLFPNAEIDNGNNRLDANKSVLVPSPAHPFVFDESPGTEKLFIVLSRQPEADLNELVRAVKAQQPGGAGAASQTMVASNNMGKIRSEMLLASRGIVVEGVKKGGENAVYMVNTSTQPNTRVVTDIVLKHEK